MVNIKKHIKIILDNCFDVYSVRSKIRLTKNKTKIEIKLNYFIKYI
jgi:hypothetical protein